jgi:ABC-2 type transport system ATP-binding protein
VSFDIGAGEIVGLLGPNGAGKTTTMKIMTGYLQPDEGDVRIAGLDVMTDTRQAQAGIGYLPENAPLYRELSVQSYLKMMAELRAIPAEAQLEYISQAVIATGLVEALARPIGELSKGMRQRVGLAQAILHRPKILILDEPTIGLDPTQIVQIRALIRRIAAESTVLFSTHILSEVEALCDRVIIIINGQVKADARLSELATSSDAILILQEDREDVVQTLRGLQQVRDLERSQTPQGYPCYRILGGEGLDGGDLCPQIYHLASANAWPVRELRQDERTLETVFNELATAA